MTASLAHRGPDGDGFWTSASQQTGLGHRRLAILDLATAADQPMVASDGRHVLVFNGEIYNFLELRDELTALGHRFTTQSDTEVLLVAWARWGRAMLRRFNGMWAFAIHDTQAETLFLARDRYGVKPLLYAERGGRFAFASEMRAFAALPWVDAEFDIEVARRAVYDPFNHEAGRRTLRRGVSRLPAGHCMTVGDDGVRVDRWWHSLADLETPPATLAEASEHVHHLLSEAVRIRMRSDVPIGSCLSGGFDSSAIVATMARVSRADGGHARESRDWRHAFVASFPGMANDETPEARLAAEYAGVDGLHVIDLSAADPIETIERSFDVVEDPAITLQTAMLNIYAKVRETGVRVTLDGHGADELMGGYRQGGQSMRFRLAQVFGNSGGHGPFATRANDEMKWLRMRASRLTFLRGRKPPRLGTPFDHDEMPAHWGAFNRQLYGMFHITILPTLLRNYDRLAMASGVEVRNPFMDTQLVQYVLALPDAMKHDDRVSKLVAREAMRGFMPEPIRDGSRKLGFTPPMPEFMSGHLGRWAHALLSTPLEPFDAIIDRPALVARIAALTAGGGWNWNTIQRVWPYVQLYWIFRRG